MDGLWRDPRARSAVDCGERARGNVREEVAVGNASAGDLGSCGGRAILPSHSQVVEPSL